MQFHNYTYDMDDRYLEEEEYNVNNPDILESEVGSLQKGSDELLIDAIRGYPHLYNSSLKEYKNIHMKDNSWSEIAKIMNMSVANCQNRWLRLRERFAKEQRLRETETRSGSGATHRTAFLLYNNLLFLENHIKRRKSYTNVSNPPVKKRLADISNTSCSGSININTSNILPHIISKTKIQNSFPNLISSISCEGSKENYTRQTEDVMETDRPFSPPPQHKRHNYSVMSNMPSTSRDASNEILSDSTPSTALQTLPDNKMFHTSTIKKKSGTYLEHSLAALSDSLKNRMANQPSQQTTWNLHDLTPEKSFGLLVATELGRLPEPERLKRKQAISDILWKPYT